MELELNSIAGSRDGIDPPSKHQIQFPIELVRIFGIIAMSPVKADNALG